jgi:ArsR family transcriptional regulator, cadmium/lead-responsive transcriptional repressor
LPEVDAVFAALADTTRRRVIEHLAAAESATATELAGELPVSRQAVAKHLATLGAAELVRSERSGRETRYRLTPEPFADAMGWMAAVGARWDSRLAALQRHLGERAGGTSASGSPGRSARTPRPPRA